MTPASLAPFASGLDGRDQLWMAQGHGRWLLSVENVEAAAAKGHKHFDFLESRTVLGEKLKETAI